MRALINVAVVNILQNPFFTHFILNEICCNGAAMAILVQLKMKVEDLDPAKFDFEPSMFLLLPSVFFSAP